MCPVLNFPVGTARFPHRSLDIFTMATTEEGYQIKLSVLQKINTFISSCVARLHALVRKDLISKKLYNKSSFLVIHKIGFFGNFVQLLTDIIGNSWELNQVKCTFTFAMMLWIHIEVNDFSILHIFKYKQYKNANIANVCVLRENSNVMHTTAPASRPIHSTGR